MIDSLLTVYREREEILRLWWPEVMIDQQTSVIESMVLFWHDHFATGASKVVVPQSMYIQNDLFRDHAFVQQATTVPGPLETTATRVVGAVPNPTIGSARIHFALEQAGEVSLAVFDVEGRRVQQILREGRPAGEQSVVWQSEPLSAGTYWLRLSGRGWERHARVAVMR